jgi:predicted metal-binding protein
MRIGIIVRDETMDACTGKSCLDAFYGRRDSFAEYGAEVELCAFTTHNGDLQRKIDKMKEAGITCIHLGKCMRNECPEYEELARRLAQDFDVVGYSHGPQEYPARPTIFLEKR